MCRCCQNCIEDLYWNCIEEKFCFDKSIVEYNPDEDEFFTKNNVKIISNSLSNNNQMPIRSQPMQRNESSIFSHAKIYEEDVRREIQTSVPILAPEILAVFNNSQIFQESQKLSRVNTKNAITPIHSPLTTREKKIANEQKKLIFHLEGNCTESNSTQTTPTISIAATRISTTTDGIFTEAHNNTPENKIKFTIADNTPLELLHKSPNRIYPIIPEKDEDEIDDVNSEIMKIAQENQYLSITSLNGVNKETSKKDSKISLEITNDYIDEANDEVLLRPNFKAEDVNNCLLDRSILVEYKALRRNVNSMPQMKMPTVRTVASETDIFSISGSGLYGSLSMTPEVPSISYAHLPKHYEDTPTIEKYKETMSLYKIQTANKERAESQIVDYSMPRYFKKTLAHSTYNLENSNAEVSTPGVKRTQSKGNSKENINSQGNQSSNKKLEKSKRLKQLRDNLPPLVIVHRHQKKEDNKHAH